MQTANLLIIDDDADFRDSLKAFLERQGYVAETAENETAALDKLGQNDFAALITDLSLNGNSGQEGLNLIQTFKQRHPDRPAFLITAFGSEELRGRAQAVGANLCLEKPTSGAWLCAKLAEFKLTGD